METFDPKELKNLYKPNNNSTKCDNGQVTVIAGSKLFHGPPLMVLKTTSRIVDMVFLASPNPSIGKIAEQIKSQLSSFIWVPWEETEYYINKSDSVLIGPGLMRYGKENEGEETREITRDLLLKFPNKKWVIDGGSLQVMEADWIPKGSVLTPNKKEYIKLFGVGVKEQESIRVENIRQNAKKYNCVIVLKGPTTIVASPEKVMEVHGGNAGLTKGGTGDVEAGLTAALLAKNDNFLAACAGSYIIKLTADTLFEKVGFNYNSDDLANRVPEILNSLTK